MDPPNVHPCMLFFVSLHAWIEIYSSIARFPCDSMALVANSDKKQCQNELRPGLLICSDRFSHVTRFFDVGDQQPINNCTCFIYCYVVCK